MAGLEIGKGATTIEPRDCFFFFSATGFSGSFAFGV